MLSGTLCYRHFGAAWTGPSYAIRDHACSVGVDPLNFAAVAPVAQLDRALRFERSGRRFESVRARISIRVRSGHMGDGLYRRNKVLPLIRKDAGSLCQVVQRVHGSHATGGEGVRGGSDSGCGALVHEAQDCTLTECANF